MTYEHLNFKALQLLSRKLRMLAHSNLSLWEYLTAPKTKEEGKIMRQF